MGDAGALLEFVTGPGAVATWVFPPQAERSLMFLTADLASDVK